MSPASSLCTGRYETLVVSPLQSSPCPSPPSSDGDRSDIPDRGWSPLTGGFPVMGSRAASSFLAAAAGWESVHETGHGYGSRSFDVLLGRFVQCGLLVPSFVIKASMSVPPLGNGGTAPGIRSVH